MSLPWTHRPIGRRLDAVLEMAMACIEQGYGDRDGMLLALKRSEKQRYVRLRAIAEDR